MADFRARLFWDAVLRDGPMCLTKQDWRALEAKLGETDRALLKHLIEGIESQTKWIVEAREKLISEAARVHEIGIVMRKAGLRSYTDEKGRIFVSEDR